jgi:hypothetical protein
MGANTAGPVSPAKRALPAPSCPRAAMLPTPQPGLSTAPGDEGRPNGDGNPSAIPWLPVVFTTMSLRGVLRKRRSLTGDTGDAAVSCETQPPQA